MTDEELKALLGDPVQTPADPLPAQEPVPPEQPDAPERPDQTGIPDAADTKNTANTVNPAEDPPEPKAAPQPMPEPAPVLPDLFAEAAAPKPALQTAGAAEAGPALPEQPKRHIFLYLMLTLLVLAVLGFAVFCVIWDIKNGTTSGGYRAGNIVRVELVQQKRSETPDTAADENGKYTFAGIAETVMPSIVEIYTYADGKMSGTGSGIILSEDGYIATNAHVVENTSRYSVKLFGDSQSDVEYNAVLVGHDTKTDLAVLKISAGKLKPAALGNSDDVHLGEEVCALGNPAGLSGSITTGIISGMNRKVRAKSTNFEMDCFQTDAAISPGNSGGALVDMYGKVIGITSSKYGSSFILGGSYEGLGFAITINQALPIIQELMEKGYVSGRVRIGIQFLDNVNAHAEAEKDKVTLPKELDGHGIQVVSISQDSDLKNTVMEDGDWILTMNGTEVSDYDSINQAISGLVGGDSVHCRCGRVQDDGTLKTFEIDFTLIEDQSGEY